MNTQTKKWTAQLAGLVTAVSLLVGCDRPAHSGTQETEHRDVTGFNAIDMRGAGKFDIKVGPVESVTLSGDSRVISRITTEVRDKTLVINRDREWFWLEDNERLKVSITLPQLTALRLSGAGDVDVSGLNGGSSSIALSGAGRMSAEGKLDELTVNLSGAGHGDFSRVDAGSATVTMSGAGSIFVHPIDALNATLNGVGSIEYEGNPTKITSAIHGIGSISQRSEHHHSRSKHSDDTDSETVHL